MVNMVCNKEYKGIGFLSSNTDKNGKVDIKVGDTIECDDQGYLWFKDICFGHKDAKPGRYFGICQ